MAKKRKIEKRDPIVVFILSIITFGIYALYWFVVTKGILNKKGGKIPTAWLLIIPIVSLYWIYRFSEVFSKKVTKDNQPVLWFLLILFGNTLILPVLQYEINKTL